MAGHLSNKKLQAGFSESQRHPGQAGWVRGAQDFFAEGATINVVHPFNDLIGPEGYLTHFINILAKAFDGLHRRDRILMGGAFSDDDTDEVSNWVSATGHYAGHFENDLLGIRATGQLTYLRFGEFHRIENGKAAESYIFLDLPELMIAAGQWPIANGPGLERGYTSYLPGPALGDGILLAESDPEESTRSFHLVTDMLLNLATPDERWRPYWHDNMLWYGPAAFGAFIGIDRFASFQVPFEDAFEGWAGGLKPGSPTRHFTRFGDGLYTCSGGWPSVSGIQRAPFMDQPATNKMLFMRVCDWWVREGDLLTENWVFVDIPDVLMQMGYDVFEKIRSAGVNTS